jgi:TRAP-type mannitol/chloroaromatic compound transport system permease small subunit
MSHLGRFNVLVLLSIIAMVGVDITLRYFFSYSKVAIMELEWYLFALFVMFSIPYCTHKDQQVRVDIFYNRYSQSSKRVLEIISLLFLVFPWLIILMCTATRYSLYSMQMGEGSPDPGGLPFRFLVKLFIPIGVLILLVISFKELILWISHKNKP